MSSALRRTVVCLLFGRAESFGFTVPAGKSECFHELAKASERLSGEWKVLKGGMMDLDVQVRVPPRASGHPYDDRLVAAPLLCR